MLAIIELERQIGMYGAYRGTRWHHCNSSDVLLFVFQDRARGEEGSHMVGIYQPMAARVIECELKVRLQTAEGEQGLRPGVYYQAVHHLP